MEKNVCFKLALIFTVAVMLFASFSFVNAEETVLLDSTLDASQGAVFSGKENEGVTLDTDYFTINTGRFKNASQTQENFYDDGEGNTFGIYVQPTSTIDPKASTYYYEDIFNDTMLEAASKSFIDTIVGQQSAGQSFNGLDELKIDELKNGFGDSYPVLFWKFSIKYGNANYFFHVYEIIDKNMMYNMTFSATSYDLLEGNDVKTILNSFKIKDYKEFDHRSKASNIVNSAVRNTVVPKIVGAVVAIVVFAALSLIPKMKKVNKEEKEIISENIAKPSVEVKPTVDDDGFITPGAPVTPTETVNNIQEVDQPTSEENTKVENEVEKVEDNSVDEKSEDNNE